jgi:hypothetical protein
MLTTGDGSPSARPYARGVESHRVVSPARLRRLEAELLEEGLGVLEASPAPALVVDELDYALRPPVHEGRIPTYGSLVLPVSAPSTWEEPTTLSVSIRRVEERADDETRKYADGRASWTIRTEQGIDALAVFDRSAGSERDLVVISEVTGAVVVQRDRHKIVRLVGPFGVVRWDGLAWHLEPPVSSWSSDASCGLDDVRTATLDRLLEFAVHDLGSRGIGALLVFRPGERSARSFERRMPAPPPVRIDRPADLAPLHHVLTQIDGAAVFDGDGVLRDLGVLLVPSPAAEREVEPFRGTRHTAARRYSHDDPDAVVVVVSEDGPVTVWRGGELIGRSPGD